MPQNRKGTKSHKIKKTGVKRFGEILCFGALVAINDF